MQAVQLNNGAAYGLLPVQVQGLPVHPVAKAGREGGTKNVGLVCLLVLLVTRTTLCFVVGGAGWLYVNQARGYNFWVRAECLSQCSQMHPPTARWGGGDQGTHSPTQPRHSWITQSGDKSLGLHNQPRWACTKLLSLKTTLDKKTHSWHTPTVDGGVNSQRPTHPLQTPPHPPPLRQSIHSTQKSLVPGVQPWLEVLEKIRFGGGGAGVK